ncbi:cytochrome c-type biogenesis protein CcmF [compost metagenome]
MLSAVASLAARLRHQQGRRLLALRQLVPSYWGMLLAHVGVGIFIAGVTLVTGQESLRELPMRAGDTVSVGGYDFRFAGVRQAAGPNYDALRGTLTASRDGKRVAVLHPERRIYRSQDMPTTEAAIDSGLTRDLYVALSENVDGSAWAVRIHVKPFVDWIWAGCVLMALGGLLAACDKRYRLRRRVAAEAAPAPTNAPAAPALASTREETPA